ncbi:hypothetical protein H0H92_007946 [Tricholoma furcatifolium]|nr:hypothetical protein H0H92_007946 [Tricholoma furcatifolium]
METIESNISQAPRPFTGAVDSEARSPIYLFDQEKLLRKTSPQKYKEGPWNSWVTGIFSGNHGKALSSTPGIRRLDPDDIVNSMVKAVKGMTEVTEYEFEWRDMPINPRTLSFLSSAHAAFYANLSKLVIHIRPNSILLRLP